MPENNKIKIREHIIEGAPDIIYYKGTVEDFFNGNSISVHIAEKLSILTVHKIYSNHNKITIEVISPKLASVYSTH